MGTQPRVDLESLHFRPVPDALTGLRIDEAFMRGERYVHLEGSPVIFHDIGERGYICEGCGQKAYSISQERKAVEGILTGSARVWRFNVAVPYCPNCEDEPPRVSEELIPFAPGDRGLRGRYPVWNSEPGSA